MDADLTRLRKSVRVAASRDVAWKVFTERIGRWWPLASHHIGMASPVDAVIEPFVGGRWYERGDDGSTCDWGRVRVWEPTARLVLTWDISADWRADALLQTEVEVTFTATGAGETLVELEHRHLDRYGDRAAEMRGIFDSEGGWTGLLALYAASAAA